MLGTKKHTYGRMVAVCAVAVLVVAPLGGCGLLEGNRESADEVPAEQVSSVPAQGAISKANDDCAEEVIECASDEHEPVASGTPEVIEGSTASPVSDCTACVAENSMSCAPCEGEAIEEPRVSRTFGSDGEKDHGRVRHVARESDAILAEGVYVVD